MKKSKIPVTISWEKNAVKIIDQTLLPGKLKYLYVRDIKTLWHAIKVMKVRGAPALGAAAALGLYLGIKDFKGEDKKKFFSLIEKVANYIASSRPTAKNLFWALERIQDTAKKLKDKNIIVIKLGILREAKEIIKEDKISCRAIGDYGATLLSKKDTVLTICNAGGLATVDYGTALGVIYSAYNQGKPVKVYACETRPMLQGARLTAWELSRRGVDVTLICDNMAATLMQQGKISAVITGADRITLNGDSANKIGTYNLAVLSKFHGIPFYIAAPFSTFDLSLKEGSQIPIEERQRQEMVELFFEKPITAKGVKVYNPAFDVTPQELITAIITDKGLIQKPFKQNIKKLFLSTEK